MGYEQKTESKAGTSHTKRTTDWELFAGGAALFLLVILCAGEPDLLDAIRVRVAGPTVDTQCDIAKELIRINGDANTAIIERTK